MINPSPYIPTTHVGDDDEEEVSCCGERLKNYPGLLTSSYGVVGIIAGIVMIVTNAIGLHIDAITYNVIAAGAVLIVIGLIALYAGWDKTIGWVIVVIVFAVIGVICAIVAIVYPILFFINLDCNAVVEDCWYLPTSTLNYYWRSFIHSCMLVSSLVAGLTMVILTVIGCGNVCCKGRKRRPRQSVVRPIMGVPPVNAYSAVVRRPSSIYTSYSAPNLLDRRLSLAPSTVVNERRLSRVPSYYETRVVGVPSDRRSSTYVGLGSSAYRLSTPMLARS